MPTKTKTKAKPAPKAVKRKPAPSPKTTKPVPPKTRTKTKTKTKIKATRARSGANKAAPKQLPHYVEQAMRDAGLGVGDRDERGLMPVAKARALLKKRTVIERGQGRDIGDTYVWDSDITWAALLSLGSANELLETAALRWNMPPRGLANPAVAERYGRDAIEWAKRILLAGHVGPCVECLVATVSAVPDGGPAAYAVLRDIDAQKPSPKYLWSWLSENPLGWRYVGTGSESADREALARLAKTDAKGAFAALAAELGDEDARKAFEAVGLAAPKGVKRPQASKGVALTIGALEPKFSEFEYPMWDNANYFTGAMRVTGFRCDAGQALVWEQIMTGLGDGGVSREVTVHASFKVDSSWRAHVAKLLDERKVSRWEGDAQVSLLTGVRRVVDGKKERYVMPQGGPRSSTKLAKIGEVPLSIDTSGLSKKHAALLGANTGPSEKLMVRLGQEPFRSKVFPKFSQLAKQAGLPPGAKAHFSFDVFELPAAGEPASSSPDIIAMVEALATGTKLTSLPSHGTHPLAALVIRCRELGGWGDARFSTG